ncbi:hypothetical protein SAMN04488029_0576 [Reichenbachiella faecimaris]|uniref:SnoaL-like domain-containing protein n=1 Tax=Reichenbachiella faecimaris TaxID=692418 RepID=A0A1W2G6J3_REIFA|nr:hypothetical protein [Reichenbachiella faecimaris]SMD32233.1 hypothetical protein SAMN04488029_0576 [Reichenbachiella faecimaris]
MKNTSNEVELKELWEKLYHKFCIEYNNDFSNQDVDGWLSHFVPNQKINVYQYGIDATGKKGKGKTIKIYTGSIFSSLIKGRISAKLMAKIVFKRLAKQNYSHSETELLGIQNNINTKSKVKAHFSYKRFNAQGEMYDSGIGLYSLLKVKNQWLINEMSVYDTHDEFNSRVDLSQIWHPSKGIS